MSDLATPTRSLFLALALALALALVLYLCLACARVSADKRMVPFRVQQQARRRRTQPMDRFRRRGDI